MKWSYNVIQSHGIGKVSRWTVIIIINLFTFLNFNWISKKTNDQVKYKIIVLITMNRIRKKGNHDHDEEGEKYVRKLLPEIGTFVRLIWTKIFHILLSSLFVQFSFNSSSEFTSLCPLSSPDTVDWENTVNIVIIQNFLSNNCGVHFQMNTYHLIDFLSTIEFLILLDIIGKLIIN